MLKIICILCTDLVQRFGMFEISDVPADLLYVLPFVVPWNEVVRPAGLVGGDEIRVVQGRSRFHGFHERNQLDLEIVVEDLGPLHRFR